MLALAFTHTYIHTAFRYIHTAYRHIHTSQPEISAVGNMHGHISVSSPEPCFEFPLEVSLGLLSYGPLLAGCLGLCFFVAPITVKLWI